MTSDTRTQPLGNFVTLISGNTPSKSNPVYWDGSTPWISAKDMGEFWIDDSKDHLTSEGVKVASRLIPAGSVLLLTRGMTLHKRVPICRTAKPATFNQDVKAVLPKTGLSARFLPYLLTGNHDRLHQKVDSAGHGTGRLNTDALLSFPVWLPELREQEAIADLGEALDERIKLLRETNATLEAIAQALFKSWFVDFGPVLAKMEGRVPEGMDEETAALFPDGFEESELGLMPRGWRVGSINDLCSLVTNGGTPSRSRPEFWMNGSIPWYKTGEFNDGFMLNASEHITEAALENSSAKLLPEHAILMAIYAAPTVGRLGILTKPATFNQACTGMVAKSEVGTWYLYWSLFFGRTWFNNRANGAAQQNISKGIVASYPVIVPAESILANFHEIVANLHDGVRTNAEMAANLSAVRDTLLPRLISGRLRLPEAEAIVSEHV